MHCKTLPVFAILFASAITSNAQKQYLPAKTILAKSNLLNLVAKGPSLSVEKPFSKTVSAELSYLQGSFNNILFTDSYKYTGTLLRVKKYFSPIKYQTINPYAGIYTGLLKRNIKSAGHIDNTGWFSWPSREVHANSLRSGGSIGILFIGKKRLLFDAQTSLGYGKYFGKPNGYLDVQLWFSAGYCFKGF